MAQTAQLSAESRTVHGTGEMRRLRRAGRTPAVIYGHGREPEPLTVNSFELGRLLEHIAPASTIVDLSVGGTVHKTLIREVQRHPLRPGIVHVDFYEVRAGEKITLEVPVHLVGIPDGVRNQGGTLDQVLRMIEIEVLPTEIPEKVELDVTALTIGKSLPVSALTIPNARILTDATLTVCTGTKRGSGFGHWVETSSNASATCPIRWTLIEDARYALPGAEDGKPAGGHDLSLNRAGDHLFITTVRHAYLFDITAERFLPYQPIADVSGVKCLSEPGDGGPVLMMRASESWWSDTLRFVDDPRVLHLPGARFYKARWWPQNAPPR